MLSKPVPRHLDLYEGRLPPLRSLCCDAGLRKAARRALEAKAHDLLIGRMRLLSQQYDHCCCGKALTDTVPTTRGIRPECIRLFGCWTLKPPTAVERYRQAYLESLLKA